MRSMKEQLSSMGDRLAKGIGVVSIKVTDEARSKCLCYAFYEPKIPMEILEESKEK